MEKKLSNDFRLILKDISLRRVSVILWSSRHALALIDSFFTISSDHNYCNEEYIWRETVESKVTVNMSEVLPPLLKKRMLFFSNPVGLQIRNWLQFHKQYLRCPLGVSVLAKLCWTTVGTIDYLKTAKELLRYEMVDIVKRYKLACLYCMEDYIPSFWKELPEKFQRTFYNEDTLQIQLMSLQFCWPYIVNEEYDKLNDICTKFYGHHPITFQRHAFESSAEKGNKAAAEYFFQKLPHGEKKDSVFTATLSVFSRCLSRHTSPDEFPLEKVADCFCYLLNLMNQEQRIRTFREFPYCVLLCFLEWPWQNLLFDLANHVWEFLPADDYVSLLWKMTLRFKFSEHYFTNLFQEFFIHSPDSFRKQFVDQECQSGRFFREFCHPAISQFNSSETIKVVFRNVDNADRLRLVSSEHIFVLFCNDIMGEKFYVVELCLQEATLSKEDRETVNVAFMEFLTDGWVQIQNWELVHDQFFDLLEKTALRNNSSEITDKRFCA